VWYLAESYLRPESQAALYEAAAAVPGLRTVENATRAHDSHQSP
jgi:hypothetical protein